MIKKNFLYIMLWCVFCIFWFIWLVCLYIMYVQSYISTYHIPQYSWEIIDAKTSQYAHDDSLIWYSEQRFMYEACSECAFEWWYMYEIRKEWDWYSYKQFWILYDYKKLDWFYLSKYMNNYTYDHIEYLSSTWNVLIKWQRQIWFSFLVFNYKRYNKRRKFYNISFYPSVLWEDIYNKPSLKKDIE